MATAPLPPGLILTFSLPPHVEIRDPIGQKPLKYPFYLLEAFEKHPLASFEAIDYFSRIELLTNCNIPHFLPKRPQESDYKDERNNLNQLNYIIALDKYIKRIDGIKKEVLWAKNKIVELTSNNRLLKEDYLTLKRLYFVYKK
jgi:hypothetical protein